jgi:hypothetical protein
MFRLRPPPSLPNAYAMSLIRDVYPGSEFFHPRSRIEKVPDPGSTAKNLSIFNPKILKLNSRKKDLGYLSWIWNFSHAETGQGSRVPKKH